MKDKVIKLLNKVIHTSTEGEEYTIRDILQVFIMVIIFLLVVGIVGHCETH